MLKETDLPLPTSFLVLLMKQSLREEVSWKVGSMPEECWGRGSENDASFLATGTTHSGENLPAPPEATFLGFLKVH